eukprot:TRINITY_DN51_c11_g1_i1.p1 TRINITY_DN51_c11_g1~~TRINITY_DN51_c11_g1_i1.p1  ORF type:complete len:423 (+),score=59.90 TRINITY_DN51_c11_g1_i1:71-1339(+)
MEIEGITPSRALETAVQGIDLVQKYAAVHSCHEEDYFIKNPMKEFGEILAAGSRLQAEELIGFGEGSDVEGELLQYLKEVIKASLPRKAITGPSPAKVRKGFTPKKHHEAFGFEGLLSKLSNENDVAINFGEGAGHLTEVIAQSGCVRAICGFDCDASLTAASNSRAYHPSTPVEAVTCRVSPSLQPCDYADLINNCDSFNFKVSPTLRECSFIGLHTCGDLGSSITAAFVQSEAHLLFIVPCCYHALTDEGFPMSDVFKSASVALNDTSKRLACTPVDRWSAQSAVLQLPLYRLRYYRAVLAAVVHPKRVSPGKSLLRRLSKESNLTLTQYVTEVLVPSGVSEDDVKKIVSAATEIDTPFAFQEFLTFLSVRRCLSPPIEALINIDRLLYLSQYVDDCSLVPLFDPEISPRHYAILARRER